MCGPHLAAPARRCSCFLTQTTNTQEKTANCTAQGRWLCFSVQRKTSFSLMPAAQPCQGKGSRCLTIWMVAWKQSIFWSVDEQPGEARTPTNRVIALQQGNFSLKGCQSSTWMQIFFTMKNISTYKVLNIYAKQTINNSFTPHASASFEMHQCFYQYSAMDLHCTE